MYCYKKLTLVLYLVNFQKLTSVIEYNELTRFNF